ncbi:serine/threonine protein phosphatase 1 [Sphingomonas jinjuensis]|uniref:Serine/threonine protein phosphatase 1 n=1 Tax=Sphingomonas jinjuensis TaxID=535907 RepID=A0A840F621_9SPHN|nr:metallophosphoesterase family protein [Sphingomonas jinjuensis]MBB4153219.1 serine/threonine protein phosphatase 1 [Sphingomonas jinjuensis]
MITLRRETHAPPGGATVGRPVYAIGDIHGCYDLLHALLAEIGRDAAARDPDRPALLIFCGDYIDRGPESAKVLAALAWLVRSNSVDVRLLEGNHEAMLRLFLKQPIQHRQWLMRDGRFTLESYGIAVPSEPPSPAEMIELRDALLDHMPASHHQLLRQLELVVEYGDYAFVHAGIVPGVPIAKQERDDILWIRREFLDYAKPFEKIIVHGHSWLDDRPMMRDNRLGIDTGAYETGVLTAARISDDAVEVIQARREATLTQEAA